MEVKGGAKPSSSYRWKGFTGRASLWHLSRSSGPHKCRFHLGFSLGWEGVRKVEVAGVGSPSGVSQLPQKGASSRVQDQQSATTANPRANAVRRHVLPPVYVRPVDRSHQVRADSRLSQCKANPGRLCRQGTLFVVPAPSLSEFPGAALGVSRLARSAYVRRLLTGKLPPVLSAWVDDASPYLYYVFRHRFGFLPADDSCPLTSFAPRV